MKPNHLKDKDEINNNEKNKFFVFENLLKSDFQSDQNSFYKKIEIGHIQYLLLRLIGGLNITSNFDLYFQILKKNLHIFKHFLENIKNFHLKYPNITKHIYKLEMVILNFLLKFMNIRDQNYKSLQCFVDTSITQIELITLLNS